METLPNEGPVAVSIDHGICGVSHCSESGARDLLELMRAAIKGAEGADDERSIISTDMESTKGIVHIEWKLGNARSFADDLDDALSLREARRLAQGKVIGTVTQYTRDAAHEIVEAHTRYQY